MNAFLKSIALLGLLFTSLSCSVFQSKKNVTVLEMEVFGTPKPAKGNYNPSRTRYFDLLHTRLDVSFDFEKRFLNGVAELTLVPIFYPQDSLVLDAKGMDIHKVEYKINSTPIAFTYDSLKLCLKLPKTYTKADTLGIRIHYTAKPNLLPKGGSDAITEEKGLYFINPDGKEPYKPTQIWTQGETEASSCWFPTIDAPNEKTTQEMYIRVDTSFTVLSNGELMYERINGDGTKTSHWQMKQPHAPYLFMMAIGHFTVVKDKWKDKEVNYYVEPEYGPYAKAIFGNTPEMIGFFSEKLGTEFPWSKYSQVVVRDYVSGAMENTTATVFMEDLHKDSFALADENWDFIIAHELFHHWFGDLVTCESWANLPLNESFANYSEYLWAEHKYGRAEADYHRVEEMEGYLEESIEKQEPLIRYQYLDKEDMFDAHSYNKGGCTMHMLRKYLGDDAFFTGLKLYLKNKAYQTAEIHDLRMAFEEVTGEDLNWFFNQWFLTPGHPVLTVDHTFENGVLTMRLEQIQDTTYSTIYRLPLAIDLFFGKEKIRKQIVMDAAVQEFRWALKDMPDLVLFDAEDQLLGEYQHKKANEEWVRQTNVAPLYHHRYLAYEAIFGTGMGGEGSPFAENPENIVSLQKALKDSSWVIRQYALVQFTQHFIPMNPSLQSLMEGAAASDPNTTVRSTALYLLQEKASRDNALFTSGLEAKSYFVMAAALYGLLVNDPDYVSNTLVRYEAMPSPEIIEVLAEYYSEKAVAGKFTWFKEKMVKASDRGLYRLVTPFAKYAASLSEKEKDEARVILTDVAKNNHYEVIRQKAETALKLLGN
jgi:aminopeptidase N